jgi:hypothetical protein
MKPVLVEVFFPIPEGWGLCLSCEAMLAHANLEKAPYDRALESLPQDWVDDFVKLRDLVLRLTDQFDGHILLRIWDPRSVPGVFKCLRYWIRRYPSFVIDNRIKVSGWDIEKLKDAITRILPGDTCHPGPASEPQIGR